MDRSAKCRQEHGTEQEQTDEPDLADEVEYTVVSVRSAEPNLAPQFHRDVVRRAEEQTATPVAEDRAVDDSSPNGRPDIGSSLKVGSLPVASRMRANPARAPSAPAIAIAEVTTTAIDMTRSSLRWFARNHAIVANATIADVRPVMDWLPRSMIELTTSVGHRVQRF